MQDLEKDIRAGILFLELYNYQEITSNIQSEFESTNYTTPFSRTNEDLESYYKYFPIENKNILTVVGSGDQILQAVKDCPKEIHAFDQNPLAIYMAKLKIAGLQALDYSEYKELFDYFYHLTEKEYYKLLREYLDDDAKKFWDTIYKKIQEGRFSIYTRKSGCFNTNKGSNSYEHIDNYHLTKNNINKTPIYYYTDELFKLFDNIPNDIKFDTVVLSNIYDWLSKKNKKIFCEFVKSELVKHLAEDGIIDVYSPVKWTTSDQNPKELKEFTESLNMNDDYEILVYKKK